MSCSERYTDVVEAASQGKTASQLVDMGLSLCADGNSQTDDDKSNYFLAGLFFERALSVDQRNIRALDLCNRVVNNVFKRWNFRMINDVRRAEAYLAAFTHLAPTACGSEPSILEIGCGSGLLSILLNQLGFGHLTACDQDPIQFMLSSVNLAAEAGGGVKLVNGSSLELTGQTFDVVVAEIFDAGLFGEGCLATYLDVCRRLSADRTVLIPGKASLFLTLIECPYLRQRHYSLWNHNNETVYFLSDTCGHKEPYSSEFLHDLAYTKLSNDTCILTVDFKNQSQLEQLMSCPRWSCSLSATSSGIVDAAVLSFELDLGFGISITTRLQSGLGANVFDAWEQAVFRLPRSGKTVSANDEVVVDIGIIEDGRKLLVDFIDPFFSTLDQSVAASEEEILLMNDEQFNSVALNSLHYLMEKTNGGKLLVVSCSDELVTLLPLYAVAMGFENVTVVCTESSYLRLLNLCRSLNSDEKRRLSHITFSDDEPDFVELFDGAFLESVVAPTGYLSPSIGSESLAAVLKLCTSEALICPASISVCGQLFYSEQLQRHSSVSEPLTIGTHQLHIGESVNWFSSLIQQNIDLQRLDMDYLSEEIHSPRIPLKQLPATFTYNYSTQVRRKPGQSHRILTGILLWLEVGYPVRSSDEQLFSTKESASFAKIAFLQHNMVALTGGSIVDGLISIDKDFMAVFLNC